MTTTLLVLAAGLGSRFGGAKQQQAVGPSGETLFDYAAYDALQAGFERCVLVTRPELLADIEEQTFAMRDRLDVRYVVQRLSDLPPHHPPPPSRTKPWGTAHAVLCAGDHLDGPFGVLNGDDFYGRDVLATLGNHLARGDGTFAVVGYRLLDTLSEHGGVTRAVCRQDADGFLTDIVEVTGIVASDGAAEGRTLAGDHVSLSGEETISRNCWGFTSSVLEPLAESFDRFLDRQGTSDSAEFLLPVALQALVARRVARVRVLPGRGPTYGLTHPADLPGVRDAIHRLVATGVYPSPLWS